MPLGYLSSENGLFSHGQNGIVELLLRKQKQDQAIPLHRLTYVSYGVYALYQSPGSLTMGAC